MTTTTTHERAPVGVRLHSTPSSVPATRTISREQEEAMLSCLLARPETWNEVQDLISWRDFSTDESDRAQRRDRRALAQAVWACGSQTPPITVNRPNVLDQLRRFGFYETSVDPVYVQHLDDRGTQDVLRGRLEYAERLAVLGRARALYLDAISLSNDLRSNPDEVDSLATAFLEKAASIAQGGRITRDPTGRGVLANRTEEVASVPTGFSRLDRTARILTPSRITAILAKQGGRKTSTALNFIMGPVYRGASAAYFSFRDNTREELVDQLLAMRATSLLRHWHVTGQRTDCPPESWVLSPEGLYQYFQSRAQLAAIQAARREFDEVLQDRIRFYDAEDGIIDLDRTIAVTRTDIARFRGQIVVYDYMQGLDVPGAPADSDWAIMRTATKRLHREIREKRLAGIMISQLNAQEEIRGGGDLRDAAAVIMRVGYSKERPDAITYELDKGRFSRLADAQFTYAINPSSGLILNPAARENEAEAVYAGA